MEDHTNDIPQATTDWRFWRKAVPALAILVAFLIFLIQNTEPVEVEFLVWSVTTGTAILLLTAAVSGALTWELVRRIVRRRRS